MKVKKVMVNAVAALVFTGSSLLAFYYMIDSTPEMAWSQSKNRCVRVIHRGNEVPNGCERVDRGELRVESYTVK